MAFPAKCSDSHSSPFKALLSLYERCQKFAKICVQDVVLFRDFSMFGSIIGCVFWCPRDKLCDESLPRELFKRSVEAKGWEIQE